MSDGRLARLGFREPAHARQTMTALGESGTALLPLLARTADPDLALDTLIELADRVKDRRGLITTLTDDEEIARRLLSVLGASQALGQHLLRHPSHWEVLADPAQSCTRPAAFAMRETLLHAVGADPESAAPVATLPDEECVDRLRVEYRRLLLGTAARDLAQGQGVDDTAAELSDLAAATLDTALAVARQRVGDKHTACRLAVVAMGKCGGHELNYVSDVDVIFVAEPAPEAAEATALKIATQIAAAMMQVCSDHTAEGTIWPVDANLRPEGKQGPLVRSLSSHHSYYERWAKTWEFQALLKSRPVAGDPELGQEYADTIRPLVWEASQRPDFVEDVQAMRRRVLDNIPTEQVERQLKLGPGGLRDVEFAVQLLQMVHGRDDPEVRAPATMSALHDLTVGGYVGRDDGKELHDAYAFLRMLEHRMQLWQLRRTHVVPDDAEALRRLGRSLGMLTDPATQLDKELGRRRREVRRLHEKLFYRPLLSAVARTSVGLRLSSSAASTRLAALGYQDPAAALRHLEALTAGVSRAASIQKTLLPAMLEWFANAPDPDAGLFGFRQISEAMGRTPWYLKLLRDEGQTAERLATVLATSRYATDLLRREPEGVRILADERLDRLSLETITAQMRAAARRRDDAASAVQAIRGIRRRELLRISVADLCVPFGVAEVGYALTDVTTATLEATMAAVTAQVERDRARPMPTRMAIVAMGRYGGHELGYGSDADVMFVHDPDPDADPRQAEQMARAVANEMRNLLTAPATDPALEVDADLRPEGKQGPLVRTLASYRAYYGKWSAVWEAQALLRAEAVVGDPRLRADFTAMIDDLRFPAEGLPAKDAREVRRIKARVDDERLPKGADPASHFKLGRGGLADIEWTVQLLQMQHAGAVPGLRTTKTLEALEAAVEAGLLERDDADVLSAAWLEASRLRNATVQVRGRPSDQLPRDSRERAAVAAICQYPPGHTDAMVNTYLRKARRAHAVVEKVFW